jgi:N-acetylglucosaminyldiphosphoundecaprenol N-acetyl-beta-D-mannosaminyltransferase
MLGTNRRRIGQRGRIRLGEIWIDALTLDEVLEEIESLVGARRGGFVLTPNVDHVVKADTSEHLRQAYEAASLSLADGMPLIWTSRLLGCPLPEKVSGSDLIVPLMRVAAQHDWGVYLLGGAPGVVESAARILRARMGVRIVGTDSPVIASDVPADVSVEPIERIRRARPDIVLVALGGPKQEIWIHRTTDAIRPAVAVGVGAGLDFFVGRVRRAPAWVSRAGLEWLFRLAQEPRRLWRRYLAEDPKFLLILARTWRCPIAERVDVRPGGERGAS